MDGIPKAPRTQRSRKRQFHGCYANLRGSKFQFCSDRFRDAKLSAYIEHFLVKEMVGGAASLACGYVALARLANVSARRCAPVWVAFARRTSSAVIGKAIHAPVDGNLAPVYDEGDEVRSIQPEKSGATRLLPRDATDHAIA